MIRILLLFLAIYLLWRFIRPSSPSHRVQTTPGPRRHAADFSDVQDAEFEDITPPPPSDPDGKK